MIQTAQSEMIPALKALWKECFHDSDAYLSFYFENRFRPDEMLVFMEEGKPVSMLTLMDAGIRQGELTIDAKYIYAVATAEHYRGRGLSTALLRYARQVVPKECGLFLVPASEDLFRFYRKCGFVDGFVAGMKKVEVTPLENTHDCVYFEITAQEYVSFRDAVCRQYVCWSLEHIAYAFAENKFMGGMRIMARRKEDYCAFFGYRQGETLVIKEWLGVFSLALAFAAEHGFTSILAKGQEGDMQLTGLWHGEPLDFDNYYLNIVLD